MLHTRLQGDWSSDVCSSDLKRTAILCCWDLTPQQDRTLCKPGTSASRARRTRSRHRAAREATRRKKTQDQPALQGRWSEDGSAVVTFFLKPKDRAGVFARSSRANPSRLVVTSSGWPCRLMIGDLDNR